MTILTHKTRAGKSNRVADGKILQGKLLIFILLGVIIAFEITPVQGCLQTEQQIADSSVAVSNFASFEKKFAKRLSSDKQVIKLIGYNVYPVADEVKQELKKLMEQHKHDMDSLNTVFADDLSSFRVYFPLHTAIVEYEGKTYTANEKGLVSIPDFTDINKIKVIGRKKSETVHGTGSNIIEKDKILLKEQLKISDKQDVQQGHYIGENTFIFCIKK
ncbi:MAG: hypothetical protein LBD59_05675 [Prevotellaceae bacterium]|jgi:hypothetical protein|nr:hypothetical protein [Prevotellaceae bacterium]